MLVTCPKCGWKTDASRGKCLNCEGELPTEGKPPAQQESQARRPEDEARQIAPDLTDEERRKIVQEENLRAYLRQQTAAGKGPLPGGDAHNAATRAVTERAADGYDAARDVQGSWRTWVVATSCSLLFLFVILPVGLRGCTSASGPISRVTVGSKARLHVDDKEAIPVAASEQSFDRLTKASVAEDTLGIAELAVSGMMFEVPNDTRVLVIDEGFLRTQIRVLEGDHFGRTGWVPFEWVK